MKKNCVDYWVSQNEIKNTCPNAVIFRFIAALGRKIKGANFMEIGVGHGADILEMARRGAKVHGVDINKVYLGSIRAKVGSNRDNFVVLDVSTNDLPFPDKHFDIVLCHEVIYYFTYDEIEQFFKKVRKKLSKNGVFIFNIIQHDLLRPSRVGKDRLYDFKKFYKLKKTFASKGGKENPIKFLPAEKVEDIIRRSKLRLVGSKVVIESYDSREKYFRYHKYYACSR